MQKQAPSVGRILIAAGFAISCFLLIMFLWIAFGGPVPLKAKSYRITAYFPEATQLAAESDIRIGGVSVGKVKEVKLAPPDKRIEGYDTTEAVLEIRPEFAPISDDARAILRQKTLLGETYVELTSGTEPGTTDNVSLGAAAGVYRRRGRGGRVDPRGRHARGDGHAQRDPDRRDLQRARPRDSHRLPAVAAVGRGGGQGPLARLERRLRQHRPVHHGRVVDARDPEGAEGVRAGARARHRRGLRGRVRARSGPGRRDHRLRGDLRRPRRRRRRACREHHDPAHLPARVAPDARAPRRVPGGHAPARPEAAAGRKRHQPDARQRARSSRPTSRTSSATSIRSSTHPRTASPRSSASLARKGSSRSWTPWTRSSRT